MFEITDEFLAQAGFTSLNNEQKTALKEQVSQSVQNKIGDRIVNQVGEERAQELVALTDGNTEHSRASLENINPSYRESEDFKKLEELGKANGASDNEILQEYAKIVWMKHNGITIAEVIQDSMNEAMTELQSIYEQAVKAVNDRNQ